MKKNKSSKKNKKMKREGPWKDLSRWKPTDDLALITNVQQVQSEITYRLGSTIHMYFCKTWYGWKTVKINLNEKNSFNQSCSTVDSA